MTIICFQVRVPRYFRALPGKVFCCLILTQNLIKSHWSPHIEVAVNHAFWIITLSSKLTWNATGQNRGKDYCCCQWWIQTDKDNHNISIQNEAPLMFLRINSGIWCWECFTSFLLVLGCTAAWWYWRCLDLSMVVSWKNFWRKLLTETMI